MKRRLEPIIENTKKDPSMLLREIFDSQLKSFAERPAIVSVIFSEGIFQFNKELSTKVSIMMEIMQMNISTIVKKGQNEQKFGKILGAEAITTIIMGSMRMVVLKWKLSGNRSNLNAEGNAVLNGILRMIEK